MKILQILLLSAGVVFAQPAAPVTPSPAKPPLPAKAAPKRSEASPQGLSRSQRLLLDLENDLAEARKLYTEPHPKIADLKSQVERARRGLERTRSDSAAAAEQARVAAAQAREAAELARLQADLTRVDNLWRDRGLVSQLNLTPVQVKQMEDIFRQHRLRLIDLNAVLEKEEVRLEPMVAAETLDESKLIAQIDRVAQARAELEKSRGRMLVGIRKVLEPEQWRKLSEMGFPSTSRRE
jgi:Spy/CpxP family protein refolding chaperone